MIKRVGSIFFLFIVILFIAGCSSGGGGSVTGSSQVEAPEMIVQNMIAQWHSSSSGPVFSADASGKPIVMNSDTTSDASLGYITFDDLSGETWNLRVDKVVYTGDSKAAVHTSYVYESETSGGLVTIFYLYKEDAHWFVSDISVTELPAAISSTTGIIQGYITDQVNGSTVSSAKVEAYLENSETLAGSAVTASNGFYQISDLQPGTYYLVIARDGYAPYTKSGIIVN